ncbi:MAG: double zinc ribbon domain-containing protein [Porticoccaceae bacterium]
MDFAKKLLALQQTLFPRSCSLCREALHPRQQTLCTGCLDSLPFNTQS